MKKIQFPRKAFSFITKIILSVLAPYLIYIGCVKIADEKIQITLDVSKTSLDFIYSGAEESFSVNSNYNWTVKNDASWLTISPLNGANNGTIKVVAIPNTNTDSRTATITVSNNVEGVSGKTLNVIQQPFPSNLSVSLNSLSFSPSGEQKQFTVTSNISWNVGTDASWLTVSPTSGSSNGTITVTSEATNSQRTANITVSGGGITRSISVTQEEPNLTVSQSSLSFSSSSEQKTFSISSNTSWTVSRGSDSWLTVSPTSGSNNGTITVTASSNTSTSERTATITVSGDGITRNINVTQEGVSVNLTVSTSSLSFSSFGEQKTFSVSSNTSWTVSRGSASWITVSPSSGSNNGTITVTVATNSSTSQRTATITISGDGISPTIEVTQAGTTTFDNYTETTNGFNLAMIAVQGGTFIMGCTSEQGGDCSYDETPIHQVTLSDFYIGKYEVTQGQWMAIMGNNPSYFLMGDNYPVELVSWDDIVGTSGSTMVIKNITYYANGFIYKLNQLTGKQYRLPTEAEWEYTARGGWRSNGYKYSGSNTIGDVAWYRDNSENITHAVGGKSANELGIYDMSGNVYEWCSDWWSGDYYGNAPIDPTGPSNGYNRVFRGGGWDNWAFSSRVSCRLNYSSHVRRENIGFRLACSSN